MPKLRKKQRKEFSGKFRLTPPAVLIRHVFMTGYPANYPEYAQELAAGDNGVGGKRDGNLPEVL